MLNKAQPSRVKHNAHKHNTKTDFFKVLNVTGPGSIEHKFRFDDFAADHDLQPLGIDCFQAF